MTINFDYFRHERIGLPESVYCEGKDIETINQLLKEFLGKKEFPVLFTRLSQEKFDQLNTGLTEKIDYDPKSSTAIVNGTHPPIESVSVAIVAAGSSDLTTARETSRTLEHLGISNQIFSDVGVAGIWRLEKRMDEIQQADVVIVTAGMEGALASVLGGLIRQPIIAVPTSVGYGVSEGGIAALHSMLASCAPGIVVTNIDNGYGAACAAFRIVTQSKKIMQDVLL
jgi:NCAIR mutase (PurE)-related protein